MAEHECIEIKKYSNRRFYDRTHSRHVTLDAIRDLVVEGRPVRVVDSATGRDITGRVLTQIILEIDADKVDLLPVELLLRLIRSNEERVRRFFENFIGQSFHLWMNWISPEKLPTGETAARPPYWNPWEAMLNWSGTSSAPNKTVSDEESSQTTGKKPASKEKAKAADEKRKQGGELDAIRNEIRALEAKLEKLDRGS